MNTITNKWCCPGCDSTITWYTRKRHQDTCPRWPELLIHVQTANKNLKVCNKQSLSQTTTVGDTPEHSASESIFNSKSPAISNDTHVGTTDNFASTSTHTLGIPNKTVPRMELKSIEELTQSSSAIKEALPHVIPISCIFG